jgi:hypothetical protein
VLFLFLDRAELDAGAARGLCLRQTLTLEVGCPALDVEPHLFVHLVLEHSAASQRT